MHTVRHLELDTSKSYLIEILKKEFNAVRSNSKTEEYFILKKEEENFLDYIMKIYFINDKAHRVFDCKNIDHKILERMRIIDLPPNALIKLENIKFLDENNVNELAE